MRVLQFVNYFHPSIGGTQLATYHLSRALAKRGIEVEIVTLNLNPSATRPKNGYFSAGLPSVERVDGIRVHRFPVILFGRTSGPQPRFKTMFSPSAMRKVLQENPDIVHFQGGNEVLQAAVTSYASAFRRSKTVLTVHGMHAQIELFKKKAPLRWVNELLLKLVLRKVDRIVALSDHDIEILKHLGIPLGKVSVIPNGVDVSRYQLPSHCSQSLDHEYGVNPPFVLCVTRIRDGKGIEFLMRAAGRVISRRPDVKFLVVGDLPKAYAVILRRLANKLKVERNFVFTGQIPHNSDRLTELYKRAEFFVLPSTAESFPLVLLEAMAAGLPVVASRVGGIPDVVGSAEGILIAPGDVIGLSSAMLRLLLDDGFRSALGRNAKLKAEAYSWDKIAERTISVYEEVLGSQGC